LWFLDGTYYLSDTITLGDDDSGGDGYKVYWKAYAGASPVLSGGTALSSWSDDTQSFIKKATASHYSRNLWVNGNMAFRVKGSVANCEFYRGGTDNLFEDVGNGLPSFGRVQDLEFVWNRTLYSSIEWGNIPMQWAQSRVKVASYSSGVYTLNPNMLEGPLAFEEWTFGVDDYPNYVEHAYELLTTGTKGEFYVNSATNVVYYVPNDGENMGTAQAIIGKLPTLVQSLTADPVHDFEIDGLTFSHTTWTVPDTEGCYIQYQAGGYISPNATTVHRLAAHAVHLQKAADVVVKNCTFTRLGAGGIEVGRGSSDITLSTNSFSDIGHNSISIGDLNPWTLAAGDEITNVSITNNTLDNVGITFLGSVAIAAFAGTSVDITYNTIANVPYSAISAGVFNWGTSPEWTDENAHSSDFNVSWNKVDGCLLQVRGEYVYDGGALYHFGNIPSSATKNNFVTNIGITGIESPIQNKPIYFDVWSNGFTVSGNVILKGDSADLQYWASAGDTTSNGVLSISGNYFESGLSTPTSPYIGENTELSSLDVQTWPIEAQLVYYNAGAYGDKTTLASRSGNQVTLLSWSGATIYYSWDDVTYSTYTAPLTIPEGAQHLYYYAEDAYYTEATKTYEVGSGIQTENGLITLKGPGGITFPFKLN